MHKKFLNIITANVFGCLFAASFAYADINIAVIAPQSGELETAGAELVSGAKIAVDVLNAQGGVNGQKINLISVEDKCDDEFAVSTAQLLAKNNSEKDKLNLVIGPYCSNAFNEASDIYAKAKILQLVPTPVSGAAVGVSHAGLVKMVAESERRSLDFFKYYINAFNDKNVALVYNGHIREVVDVAFALQQEFKKSGKSSFLKTYNFANYESDYSGMAKEIVKNGAEIAYISGNSGEITKLAKKLKKKDKDFIIFTNKYQAQKSFEEEMGKLAEGCYFLALPSLKDSPEFTEALVKLRLLGIEPEGLSVYSYSAVQLWKALAERANSFDYDKMAEQLQGNSFETPWGEVVFDNGKPQKTVNFSIYLRKDGEYTQVY